MGRLLAVISRTVKREPVTPNPKPKSPYACAAPRLWGASTPQSIRRQPAVFSQPTIAAQVPRVPLLRARTSVTTVAQGSGWLRVFCGHGTSLEGFPKSLETTHSIKSSPDAATLVPCSQSPSRVHLMHQGNVKGLGDQNVFSTLPAPSAGAMANSALGRHGRGRTHSLQKLRQDSATSTPSVVNTSLPRSRVC